MTFPRFHKAFAHILNLSKRLNKMGDTSSTSSIHSEKNRLMHRLNCIDLDDEEAKNVQAYITTILEKRHQDKVAGYAATQQPGCIVLEMDEPELQEFASCIGENVVRSFRAVVHSGKKQGETKRLTILSDNGLRVFHVLLQNNNRLIQQ